jgi:hypothetical protein
VDTLTGLVRQQGEIVRNLRSQVDGLTRENARLRQHAGNGICGDQSPWVEGIGPPRLEICVLGYGHAGQWHEAQSGQRWKHRSGLGVEAAESKPDGRELDPDPTRLYVLPDYGIDHRKDEER